MHGFNHSRTLSIPTSSLPSPWKQQRFLRAIPSLMVLTTAIAWGTASHAGGLALDGALRNGVNVAAGPALDAGVSAGVGVDASAGVKGASGMAGVDAAGSAGSGANRNITDEQRMAAMAAVGGDANAQGAAGVEAPGVGRTAGGVRSMGESVGGAAARTGQRATQGVRSEASGGLKGGANAATNAASGAKTGMPGTGKSGAAGARIGAGLDADAGAGLKGVIPAR